VVHWCCHSHVNAPITGLKLMAVLEIREMGDPVLREAAREVSAEELASEEVQRLIDDMIETMRAANGAGLAAPQVGVSLRIAVIEVREGNPRYPTSRRSR
jgi:peptide deformylase